jgi:hypothetical protein
MQAANPGIGARRAQFPAERARRERGINPANARKADASLSSGRSKSF